MFCVCEVEFAHHRNSSYDLYPIQQAYNSTRSFSLSTQTRYHLVRVHCLESFIVLAVSVQKSTHTKLLSFDYRAKLNWLPTTKDHRSKSLPRLSYVILMYI